MPQSGDRAREQGSRLGYTGQLEARRPKLQKAALVTPPLQLGTDGILFESHSRTRREVTESRNGVLQFYHCQVELCSRNTPRCTLLIRRLVKKKKKNYKLVWCSRLRSRRAAYEFPHRVRHRASTDLLYVFLVLCHSSSCTDVFSDRKEIRDCGVIGSCPTAGLFLSLIHI